MVKKGCYEPDCDISDCNNPEHYNFICLDPDCDDVHCENHQHYDRQLLKDFQEKSDFSVYDHREEINYDKVQIWEALINHCKANNIGILAVSHDEELLEVICDDILHFKEINNL